MGFRRRRSVLRLGTRGLAASGPHAGRQVFADSVGMTPIDPLAILVSPDLNTDHADQVVLWVDPAEVDAVLRSWGVTWGAKDATVADRLRSLTD